MDEVMDEVQQHDSPETTDQTTDAVVATETPVQSPGGDEAQDDGSHEKPHALEPGGDRFKQVYARAKDAEARLQAEREAKARLEGELEALKRQPPQTTPTPPRYTASQLQTMIDEGKATVGQVLAYQEETLKLDLARQVNEKVSQHLETTTKQTAIQREVARYREAVPEVDTPGSAERIKLEKEFTYLVSTGYDAKDPRTEVLAARAAFGDPDVAKSKRDARTITPKRDTMQDIASNGNPNATTKDPLKDLTVVQRQHYQKMIDKGVYKGWGEVKEELAFVPGR